MSEKRLFLLDAMALIYRAFFAFSKNPRINSKGQNTSAILGFANTLFDIIKNEQPTHLGVAFDTQAPTKREIEFEAYKAHRQEMPEDLAESIPYIYRLIEAFHIPVLSADGYEADDVIGTLVKVAEEKSFTTYVMTSDKDMCQLVSEKTFIYRPAFMGNKAEILGVKEVCEKYGIERPDQITDLLGLWGDSSDNIPGIPGIGEKRAKELISQFGSLENVIAHADQIKGKIAENIRLYANQGVASKQLATILLDAPVVFDETALRLKNPDVVKLKKLFDELEFKTFAARVFEFYQDKIIQSAGIPEVSQGDLFSGTENFIAEHFQTIRSVEHHYEILDEPEKIQNLINRIKQAGHFCFDTETTGTDPNSSELVGIAFALKPGEAFYLPVPEAYHDAVRLLENFKEVFENEQIDKTGQNIKFDMLILRWYNIHVKGRLFDTMLAHYLIEPEQRHNLDYLAEKYLHYRPVSYDEVTTVKGGKPQNMRQVQETRLKDIASYASEDADITLQLRQILEPELTRTGVKKVFDEIEMPLVPVLASMEAEGVKIDVEVLKNYSLQLEKEIHEIEEEIYSLAGRRFNISSPKQLGIVLFEELDIMRNPRKTKTSQYSTSEDVLIKLEHKHPIIPKILDYRSLTKLKSTYVDTLPELINPRDGRIHTSYNQAVTATGRLSSTNPNLQNIPIRTEKGREIRKAFVPRSEDYILLAADYSQIELRIIAELSQDKAMIEAFVNGQDIHAITAAKIYGVPLELVTKEMRRNAKTVNFGIIYGISSFGLAERLNISRNEASAIIENYFKQYPGIKQYMTDRIEFARKHGYVETIMGRRRYLRDINSANATIRGFAERNAINAPVQGSSADMIKIAMIRIHHEIEKRQLRSRMILQVHDELVFDAFRPEVDELSRLVAFHMKTAIPMTVPVEVDINTGSNWLEAH